jgi:hypothetical protein
MSLTIKRSSGKYAKKLIRRADLEVALDRLDKLTYEEAQMAAAEVQRATHAIDESAGGVREEVPAVDDRVADVDDEVAEITHGEQIIISEA